MYARQVQDREQDVNVDFRAVKLAETTFTEISYHHMYIELNIKANYLAKEGMQLVYNVGWLHKFKDGIELPRIRMNCQNIQMAIMRIQIY
jgi:hypothetical protein